MKNLFITLIIFLGSTQIFAQESWFVKSSDSLIIAENHISYAERIDSVIVTTPVRNFKFSYHSPRFKGECSHLISTAITINSIKKIDDKRYMLVGMGGDESLVREVNLIIINNDTILKHLFIFSIDKRLDDIKHFYIDENNNLIFSRFIVNINDQVLIYNLNKETHILEKIMPLKKNLKQYKKLFPKDMTFNKNFVFYKINL